MTNKGPVAGKTNYEGLTASATNQNRLSGFGYDPAGNMTSNGGATYTYDAENHLIAAGGMSYIYDGDGNRVEKCTACATAGTCAASPTGTLYWMDTGGNNISETDLAGAMQSEYVFFGKRVGRHDANGDLRFYLSDHCKGGMMRKTVLTLLCTVLVAGQLLAAQERHEYPLVMRAEAPLYPPFARMAKIMGKIEVEFTVKSGEVVTAEAKTGHPLLVKATTENIKTWHFSPEVNGTFATTFEYRVDGKETPTMQNPRVEMQLPAFVKITATPTKPSCNDCEPGADVVGKPIKSGARGNPGTPR